MTIFSSCAPHLLVGWPPQACKSVQGGACTRLPREMYHHRTNRTEPALFFIVACHGHVVLLQHPWCASVLERAATGRGLMAPRPRQCRRPLCTGRPNSCNVLCLSNQPVGWCSVVPIQSLARGNGPGPSHVRVQSMGPVLTTVCNILAKKVFS